MFLVCLLKILEIMVKFWQFLEGEKTQLYKTYIQCLLMFAKWKTLIDWEVETNALAAFQLFSANKIDNHPLSNVIFKCRALMQRFDSITINHIFREANKCADALTSDTPVSLGENF